MARFFFLRLTTLCGYKVRPIGIPERLPTKAPTNKRP
jgi:hypothetical protein